MSYLLKNGNYFITLNFQKDYFEDTHTCLTLLNQKFHLTKYYRCEC